MKAGSLGGIVVLAGGVAVLGYLFLGGNPEGQGSTTRWTSSQQCASCHEDIFQEWKQSLHAQAWTDPFTRELSNNFANKDCISCHAPKPVFEVGVGNRVLRRFSRLVEGVDCLSCHATPHGVAGSVTNQEVACKPFAMADLGKPIFCAGCHNQHGTVDEFEKTPFAKEGKTCNSCHMRPHPEKKHATHHFLRRGNAAGIAEAVTVEVTRKQEKVSVRVENTGAGHDFPTDSRHKAVDLVYRFDGEEKWTRLYRYRFPYRDDQFDLVRTTLPYGESNTHTLDLVAGKKRLELRFLYKVQPFMPDEEALVFWQETLELK